MKTLISLSIVAFIFFFSCTKKTTDSSTPIAVYTIGTGGACTAATVSGRYVPDTALTSANTVTITVDVSLAGPYLIATNAVNGMSFSKTSTFTSTGTQTVVLEGTGTPVGISTADFKVSAPTGLGDSCTFSVATVQDIPPIYYLNCFLNGAYKNFVDSANATNGSDPGNSGAPGLDVRGIDTVINATSKIEFGINNAGAVGAGTYTDTSATKAYFSYVDSLAQTWTVNSTSQASFTIEVTGVSANNVQGTFSGVIKNPAGTDSISVTNGQFNVPVK